jgi:NADP-dependent 3-hydroxy acid dehydrogenase YdfG
LILYYQLITEYVSRKVAMVTGSSTGIAFETSPALARSGCYTYATVRKIEEKSEKITDTAKAEKLSLQLIQLAVNDDKSFTDPITAIQKERKRIDVAEKMTQGRD